MKKKLNKLVDLPHEVVRQIAYSPTHKLLFFDTEVDAMIKQEALEKKYKNKLEIFRHGGTLIIEDSLKVKTFIKNAKA